MLTQVRLALTVKTLTLQTCGVGFPFVGSEASPNLVEAKTA